MGCNLHLVVHGRGNAWPVLLGESHPFYDRTDPRDLSNASFSVTATAGEGIVADVLVDAGHGTIQSLLAGSNRIPDSICLTHGHMDHTLSVDWVVQSYWRLHKKERLYPVYTTSPVYRFLLRSYPHLEPLMVFRELAYGIPVKLENSHPYVVTAFPAYHGPGAAGASMLLFEIEGKRVLFTGDLLLPLLREQDYGHLETVDLLVVDTNNRFPWPRTNHWSFAGHPENPFSRSEVLTGFLEQLTWETVMIPHQISYREKPHQQYFLQLKTEWDVNRQPCTILEFLHRIKPQMVLPVHYSGAEDWRYHQEPMMTSMELLSWMETTARETGLGSVFRIPEARQVIPF